MAKVGIVSLGCPRNMVDSEIMLGSLKKAHHEISDEVGEGVDVFIVNTCSFVKSAREESIDTIIEAAQLKKEGRIKYLIVAGCLGQLYGAKLLKDLPEVDSFVGTSDFPKIGRIVKALLQNRPGQENFPVPAWKRQCAVSKNLDYLYDEYSPRFLLTPGHYAYVKITEGCDNLCSYCIISRLRGRFRSRTIGSVISEVNKISEGGKLREIDLIGQDTTLFGIDRYGKSVFPRLLRDIAALKNSIKWIRILYTHPAHYTDEFIYTVRDTAKICKYLDLPVQHINNDILRRMNRHTTKKDIITLIDKIRANIPGVALRTSVIVGFPGETENNFRELLGFLKDTRFEKLGAFIYSREEGSRAAGYGLQVSDKVKKERFDEVMKLQQNISRDKSESFMGRTVDVLIDEKIEDEKDKFTPLEKHSSLTGFMGRTEGDAPEVDGSVYVSGKGLKVGEFYRVKINDTLEYDLVGDTI